MFQGRRESLVIDRPEFRFSLEPYEDHYFIHQDVRTWGPSVRRETAEIIDTLSEAGADLRVFADPLNTKLIRYAGIYGFRHTYNAVAPSDGATYYILERTHNGRNI